MTVRSRIFDRRALVTGAAAGTVGLITGVVATSLRLPAAGGRARVGLTAEERDDPLAAYFDRPPALVAPDVQRALRQGPIAPRDVLARKDIARLDQSAYLDAETGYCWLPDGRGYVAVRTEMPGVTAEMIDWWFSWVNLLNVRYKIWFPGLHYANGVTPPLAQETSRLTAMPSSERKAYWFSTAHPYEDVGFGPEAITLKFIPPKDYGLSHPDFATGKATAICTYVGAEDSGGRHSHMCHYVRPIAGGVEMRSRFWMGEEIVMPGVAGSALAPVLNSDFVRRRMINPNRPYEMAVHCAQEYANLAVILPGLFKRYAV